MTDERRDERIDEETAAGNRRPLGSEMEEADTEGHGLLVDPGMARDLARGRAADVDRASRDRQRQKEARPNRGSR